MILKRSWILTWTVFCGLHVTFKLQQFQFCNWVTISWKRIRVARRDTLRSPPWPIYYTKILHQLHFTARLDGQFWSQPHQLLPGLSYVLVSLRDEKLTEGLTSICNITYSSQAIRVCLHCTRQMTIQTANITQWNTALCGDSTSDTQTFQPHDWPSARGNKPWFLTGFQSSGFVPC